MPVLAARITLLASGVVLFIGMRTLGDAPVLLALLVAAGPLSPVALLITVVFHIDVFGFSTFGLRIPREQYSYDEDERTVFEERFVAGAFNSRVVQYSGLLHVFLSNKRLVCRFVTSYGNRCLFSRELTEIGLVRVVPYHGVSHKEAIQLHFHSTIGEDYFLLLSRMPERWTENLARQGVDITNATIR